MKFPTFREFLLSHPDNPLIEESLDGLSTLLLSSQSTDDIFKSLEQYPSLVILSYDANIGQIVPTFLH